MVIVVDYYLGLESLLRLHEFLSAAECIAVINNMAIDATVTCAYMEYLLVKSEKPGSGVAITLSCNFVSFNWKGISAKPDFNIKIMKVLLSQGAILSLESVEDIVFLVADDNIELLEFMLNELEPLPTDNVNALFSLALKVRKINFCSLLLSGHP